jgi:radical SAM protein with 4Fe4S-binding SPASM domain
LVSHPYLALKQHNDARVLAAELAGSGVVDGWPMHAVFEFTGACNLHCFMCGFEMLRDDMRAQGRTKFTMPVEMFRLVVKAAFPHIRTVNPTLGGEPFVLPYFDEFITEVARYGLKVEMFTNGMLMRGDKLRALMPHLSSLTVSFDGATKATFEHVRGGADFAQIMANIREFVALRQELGLRRKVRFGFNIVIMRENLDELAQIIEIAAAHEVDVVSGCFMVVTHERIRSSSPTLEPARTNAALALARQAAARLGVHTELPLPLPLQGAIAAEGPGVGDSAPATTRAAASTAPSTAPIVAAAPVAGADQPADAAAPAPAVAQDPAPQSASASATESAQWATADSDTSPAWIGGPPAGYRGAYYCDMAWRKVFVAVHGEVMPCCSPTRPILGNAFQEPFEQIWNGAEYRRLREGLFTGDLTDYCRKCPYLQQTGALPYATKA